MDMILHLRLGLRAARQTPFTSVVVLVTLALGIAATTVSFSIVNLLFLRPLPVAEADRMVRIYLVRDGYPQHLPISYPELADVRDADGVFDVVVGERPRPISLGVGDRYERVWGESVSDGYFPALGVQPVVGRTFTPDEEAHGETVAVISHGLWTRRFGADPDVLRATIHVDGRPFRVVGVAPNAFHGTLLAFESELWVPARTLGKRELETEDREFRAYFAIARLARGTPIGDARGALDGVATRLQREHPATNRGVKYAVLAEATGRVPPPFQERVAGSSAIPLAAALLLTVIASLNVAGIQLARALARRAEMKVRLALGATPGRLFAQLFAESSVLALAGGALGILLAWQLLRLVTAVRVPIARGALLSIDAALDERVLAVSVLCTVMTSLLFGVAPALEGSRVDIRSGLNERHRRSRPRAIFLMAQVVLSTVLLVSAGLFVRSLDSARQIDLGFQPDRAVLASVDLRGRGGDEPPDGQVWSSIVAAVKRLPRVEAASLATRLPLEFGIFVRSLAPAGFQPQGDRSWPVAEIAFVEPRFFETLGIPLLDGRDFDDRDGRETTPVVIVNDVMARQFWPNESAVGKRLVTPEGWRYEIVGVARRTKYFSVGELPQPYAYFSMRQETMWESTIVARIAGDSTGYQHAIAEEIRRFQPDAAVYEVGQLPERVSLALAPTSIGVSVLAALAMVALALTALGLFGAVAHAVSMRTFEIGIRRALGAQAGNIIRLVGGDTTRLAVAGVVLGLFASAGCAFSMRAFLFQAQIVDPLVYSAVPAVLLLVCASAVLIPALRALRVSPLSAIREDI